jgi:hypothetical protein
VRLSRAARRSGSRPPQSGRCPHQIPMPEWYPDARSSSQSPVHRAEPETKAAAGGRGAVRIDRLLIPGEQATRVGRTGPVTSAVGGSHPRSGTAEAAASSSSTVGSHQPSTGFLGLRITPTTKPTTSPATASRIPCAPTVSCHSPLITSTAGETRIKPGPIPITAPATPRQTPHCTLLPGAARCTPSVSPAGLASPRRLVPDGSAARSGPSQALHVLPALCPSSRLARLSTGTQPTAPMAPSPGSPSGRGGDIGVLAGWAGSGQRRGEQDEQIDQVQEDQLPDGASDDPVGRNSLGALRAEPAEGLEQLRAGGHEQRGSEQPARRSSQS